MDLKGISITADDIRESDWRGVIRESSERDSSLYSTAFLRAATAEGCVEPERSVFLVLGALTTLHLKPHDSTEPFGPMLAFGGSRSPLPGDFTTEQLTALSEVLDEIDDADLRARIADVLWLQTRDHRAAVAAVNSYLEAASALEDWENWGACADRLTRAFRLAVTLGRAGESYPRALAAVEDVISRCNGEDPSFCQRR